MSTAERQIQIPGESAQPAAPAAEQAPAAPVRNKPGPKPRAHAAPLPAAPAADDLAEFDGENLPPAPAVAALSAEQQQLVSKLVADGVRAAMSSRDPATAIAISAKAASQGKLPTQAEAEAMCNDMVSKNIRPRGILTSDGWYVHPEAVRTVDHGVAKLQVG